jgi:serine/threonine protein kinase
MNKEFTTNKYLTEKTEKKIDSIQFRLDFIRSILNNKSVVPLIDVKPDETNEYKNKDIRYIIPKQYFKFTSIIEQLGGKLTYIKSGSTGHTFKAHNDDINNNYNYAVKIVAYPKKENYGDMYDISRPENAEVFMLKMLSYFVINKETPHIVLPICTFNTAIKPFIKLSYDLFKNNKKFEQFIKRYKRKEYYDNVSVLISEWANGGDLLDYVRANYETMKLIHWRVIFFQLISVLAVIQAKYPSFRHNDLKANNLLIHLIELDDTNKRTYKYKINGGVYVVQNIGIQLKIWDFDFACIPGLVDNAKVSAEWTNNINIIPKKNQYYDVHYFFNTFTKKGFFPEFYTSPLIPEKAKEFVRRMVPEKYRTGDNVTARGRILVNDEYLTPDQILKNDPFFTKMRF